MKAAVRAIIRKDNDLLVMRRDKFGSLYYTLIGGGIDIGETADNALVREVKEETGLDVKSSRLVFREEAPAPYGTQYVYICEVTDGEVKISPEATESKINELGKNLYTPQWMPIKDFDKVQFRSSRLQKAILDGIHNGFPETPEAL